MNINYKQSQFELFPGSPGSNSSETAKPRYLFANLTLSVENLVVVGIVTIMTLLFSFSLGVEKGKALITLKKTPATEKMAEAATVSKAEKMASVKSATDIKPIALNKSTEPLVKTISSNKNSVPPPESSPNGLNRTQAVQLEDKMVGLMPAVVETKNPVALNEQTSYTIQVASYKDDKYAQKEAEVLKDQGLNDILVALKGDYYIVCVGKYNGKDDANKVLSKLKKKYNDCLVRRM